MFSKESGQVRQRNGDDDDDTDVDKDDNDLPENDMLVRSQDHPDIAASDHRVLHVHGHLHRARLHHPAAHLTRTSAHQTSPGFQTSTDFSTLFRTGPDSLDSSRLVLLHTYPGRVGTPLPALQRDPLPPRGNCGQVPGQAGGKSSSKRRKLYVSVELLRDEFEVRETIRVILDTLGPLLEVGVFQRGHLVGRCNSHSHSHIHSHIHSHSHSHSHKKISTVTVIAAVTVTVIATVTGRATIIITATVTVIATIIINATVTDLATSSQWPCPGISWWSAWKTVSSLVSVQQQEAERRTRSTVLRGILATDWRGQSALGW